MIVVGLTGKYCAGKNLVSSRFEHRGIPVLDVDKLGHDAIKSSHDILLKCFGTGIVGQSGEVDRKRLGAIVFSDAAQLARLEAIVHPKMVEACIRILEDYRMQGTRCVVLNAALLHRMKLDVLCDAICYVASPVCLRFVRGIRRDGVTIRSFLHVERSQKDIAVKELRGAATVHVLLNWGRSTFIHRQVDAFCDTMGL